MVFEKLGSLRYHALWAYAIFITSTVLLDKIVLATEQAVAVIVAPIALVITADLIKHRNDTVD